LTDFGQAPMLQKNAASRWSKEKGSFMNKKLILIWNILRIAAVSLGMGITIYSFFFS
jgi:hypothetical protein